MIERGLLATYGLPCIKACAVYDMICTIAFCALQMSMKYYELASQAEGMVGEEEDGDGGGGQ